MASNTQATYAQKSQGSNKESPTSERCWFPECQDRSLVIAISAVDQDWVIMSQYALRIYGFGVRFFWVASRLYSNKGLVAGVTTMAVMVCFGSGWQHRGEG